MGDKNEAANAEQNAADEQASQAEAADASEEEAVQDSGSGELEHEVDKLREALMRMRADMDNMQKRAEREMDKARRYQHEAIMRDLLPVIDGLEQGLENAAEGDSAREGLELTRKLLLKALEDHGLEVLNPEGERFDPQWHEAMSMQPSEDAEPDTVIMVLQKGYRLDDRLLRAARVIVASEP
ncbi:nucleotide exchange factor GrpE [Wenzhouxiangella sediminis]|uniref:Protein GrpE n=1 Tax=Wenzhouxiangella sediminis TaxID=1792836 RepID=A0A3E1K5C2_9GAMM|nr:nucleotide exchange factor GrpE [Wenzhouxiangella sediminis]RFF29233.1 nucleotide exchange factor GrpE [Wenzhouxiangella sediminis]